ncbi:rCG48551 [Rattus norvegicus]|uniref:RCG48551 n=1 Tax=Rattus norvegicus TaxID=10116 RepID=A6HWV2_RAT|nr:rCG48551 [Rattus norvegicus]
MRSHPHGDGLLSLWNLLPLGFCPA